MSKFKIIKINNSKDVAVITGKWKDPGAKLYDSFMDACDYGDKIPDSGKELNEVIKKGEYKQWQHYLEEAYGIAPISKIKNCGPYGITPYSRSGCKYPHHVLKKKDDPNADNVYELVVSIPGLKAAYSRAKQQNAFHGELKEHLMRHYKEMGIYEGSTMAVGERIEQNFDSMMSYIAESNDTMRRVIRYDGHLDSSIMKEIGKTPKDVFKWIRSNISYDKTISGWKLRSALETVNDRKGNCHDQSYLISFLLHSMGVTNGQIFFIEYNENNPIGGNTHTLTWYKEDDKIYWMETSWENAANIHGPYKSIGDLKDNIIIVLKNDDDINSNKYDGIAFSTRSNYKIGMSLGVYVESWRIEEQRLINDKNTNDLKERTDIFSTGDFLSYRISEEELNTVRERSNDMNFEHMMEKAHDDLDWIEKFLMEAGEEPPPLEEDENKPEEKPEEEKPAEDPPELEDEEIKEPEKEPTEPPVEEKQEEKKPEEKQSMPKQTDAKEADKNGVRRKKLYIAFIEWAKDYNSKNTFGSTFDKDVFNVTYPFIPEEMRYFYRLANPVLCVLAGQLTFFDFAELRKVNANNSRLSEMMIFAATPEDVRVFNKSDKKIYQGTEEGDGLKLGMELGPDFDTYIQNMVNQGDILNAPLEEDDKPAG